MAVEAGATCGICMPDRVTAEYLWPFIQNDYPSIDAAVDNFCGWHSDPDAVYAGKLPFDVSSLVPQVTFAYKPDHVKDITEMAGTPVDQIYIGSCTMDVLKIYGMPLNWRKLAAGIRGIVTRQHCLFIAWRLTKASLKFSWMPVFASLTLHAVPVSA